MTINKNAAQVAVAAEPCQKQPDLQPRDALDCIALGLPMSALQPSLPNVDEQTCLDCKRIFGEAHPEDVIIPIHTAADALEWLAEVFKTIRAEAGTNRRIESLASMGAFLAADMSDLAECSYAAMLQSIRNGGAA